MRQKHDTRGNGATSVESHLLATDTGSASRRAPPSSRALVSPRGKLESQTQLRAFHKVSESRYSEIWLYKPDDPDVAKTQFCPYSVKTVIAYTQQTRAWLDFNETFL